MRIISLTIFKILVGIIYGQLISQNYQNVQNIIKKKVQVDSDLVVNSCLGFSLVLRNVTKLMKNINLNNEKF